MKSVLEEKEEVLSTTPNSQENILDLETKTYMFDDTDKLTAENDVSVSDTLIEVTYDEQLRDSFSCDDTVDNNKDPLFIEETSKPTEEPDVNGDCDSVENLTNQNSSTLNPRVVLVKIDPSDFFNENSSCNSVNEICDTRLRTKTIEQRKEVKNSRFSSKNSKYLRKLRSMSSNKSKNHNSHPDKNSGNGVKRKNQSENNVLAKKFKKEDVNTSKSNNKNFKPNKKPNNPQNSEDINMANRERILFHDPELPSGWTRFIRTRDEGSPGEKHFVYIVSPQGKKFRYKWKLRRYLEKTKSNLDPDQFFFGLYKRTKPPVPKLEPRDGLNDSNCSDELSNADNEKSVKVELKELLKFDPDLPFGWRRVINVNKNNGKLQVHIISPEGRIFRRRYRLNEYLTKNHYNLNVDRFHFGLYPKKEPNGDSCNANEDAKPNPTGDSSADNEKAEFDTSNYEQVNSISDTDEEDDGENIKLDLSSGDGSSPMLEDPNLPKGWKRFIRVRGYGESAGRMEVIIISPDGRRHRSKGQLHHYLQQRKLSYNAEDFDFTVFGRNRKREIVDPEEIFNCLRRKFKSIINDNPVPDLDISSLKEIEYSLEGKAINDVNGLMISSGISTPRNERRSRVPRKEHEKIIKLHLESEQDVKSEDGEIPTYWVQRLAKCRSEIRPLEPDAASAIACRTKEFLGELCQQALKNSSDPECGLQYNDLADIVEKFECLSLLKTLIPQKITFRKFIKLNRPKQFMSFT